jgi:hypothetical protein
MTKRRADTETASPESRDDLGRFRPGVSGNPGGRPGVAAEIVNLARADSPEAYEKVAKIMRDDGSKHQLAAALAILKVAGVLRHAEEAATKPPPVSNPFAGKPTEALLQAAAGRLPQ